MASNSKNIAELLNGDVTVTATDIADGSVTTAKIADDAITESKWGGEQLGRRNLIINGAMNVWQRGTSKTFTANDNSDYHTADRWGQFVDIDQGSGSLSVTISQSTDVPSTESFSYSLKGATTPSSFVPAGEDNLALFTYKVETYNANPLGWGTSGAKPATLSYWIKSDTAGTGTLQVRLPDSSVVSGQADGNYYTTFTINEADTWEYKTHLIPANTTDGWRRSVSNIGLHIHWNFGSNQSSPATEDAWFRQNNHMQPHSSQTLNFMTTAGEAYLTGVQLEVGSEATPFEHLSFGEELLLCQRYYEHTYPYGTAPGSANGGIGIDHRYVGRSTPGNYGYFTGHYRVEKRAAATVTVYSYGGTANEVSNGDSGADVGAVGVIQNGTTSFLPRNESGSTVSEMSIMYHFKADAEL